MLGNGGSWAHSYVSLKQLLYNQPEYQLARAGMGEYKTLNTGKHGIQTLNLPLLHCTMFYLVTLQDSIGD